LGKRCSIDIKRFYLTSKNVSPRGSFMH